MKYVVFVLALGYLHASPGPTQDAEPAGFDVASVKPAKVAGDGKVLRLRVGPKMFSASGATLKGLIADAYSLNQYQISGGPNWLDSDGYDIHAVSETAVNRDQLKVMLRSVLEGRFALKFHREVRELPVYSLVVGKDGPKFREMHSGEEFSPRAPFGHLHYKDLSALASFLSLYSSARPILDMTGLNGRYYLDVDLSGYMGSPEKHGDNDPYSVLLEEALRQLGLKLVSSRAPVEMFIIDHAEKASEN